MADLTNDQFLLSCINNSDLVKAFLPSCPRNLEDGMLTTLQIDYAKVAAECKLPSAGAATKRYSRWKGKIQAELANGGSAGVDGNDTGKGSESPKKGKKTPAKKTSAAAEGTPKKTPAKKGAGKGTSAKKRKVDEDDEEAAEEKVKDEVKEVDENEL